MNYPVIKGASYALVHAPGMLVHHGTTPSTERLLNPDSEFLKKLSAHLRSFEQAVTYPPNQVFIGNMTPEQLKATPRPWHQALVKDASRTGRYGTIIAEDEFIAAIKMVDSFDLVRLEQSFVDDVVPRVKSLGLFSDAEIERLKGHAKEEIVPLVEAHKATPIYFGGEVVGCVREAHATDPTLNAHVMFENTASKASGFIVMKTLFASTGVKPQDVEYIIETSEEACGDMNQRGGGNFAKAIGEMAGCVSATGSDVRSFCAGPSHGLVMAASLIQAGVYKNVVVMAGGTTAKLGLNARDHVSKGIPALEDMMGMFAIWLGENDGVSPVFRTDTIGRHKIGSGSSPQAVMQAIVADPLERVGLKISDIDKFSPEMQNPEITEPAGAGDVPKANFKMIAALAVKKGEFDRTKLDQFVEEHGMPGYAPTQGHIPSGVPFIGPARDCIMAGTLRRVMIIGKGSLFLGRMTNQFDGVSFVMEANQGQSACSCNESADVDKDEVRKIVAGAMRELAEKLLAKK